MPGFELIGEEERRAVNELFDDGGILFAHGFDAMRNGRYRVREFEKAFSEYIGSKYAVAVTSGTAALKVGLVALGVKPGDEVITQSFTFVATVEAILDIGAVPIVVNVDDTLNMDIHELEAAITTKTKAIVPVHMLGVAARMDAIMDISKKYEIPVLDDCCESLGADWNDEKLGVQSDIAAWSFDAGKVIITGEGGMLTTDNEELYLLVKEYSDHGHMNNKAFPRGRDTHRIYGFNYRMTELQAAVGLEQLKKINYIVENNSAHYQAYEKALIGIEGIKFRTIPEQCKPLCDCLIINFPDAEIAAEFVKSIASQGMGTKNVPDAIEWHFAKYWDHMFAQFGLGKEKLAIKFQRSAEILNKSVALPIMVKTTPEQLQKNCKVLADAAKSLLH